MIFSTRLSLTTMPESTATSPLRLSALSSLRYLSFHSRLSHGDKEGGRGLWGAGGPWAWGSEPTSASADLPSPCMFLGVRAHSRACVETHAHGLPQSHTPRAVTRTATLTGSRSQAHAGTLTHAHTRTCSHTHGHAHMHTPTLCSLKGAHSASPWR